MTALTGAVRGGGLIACTRRHVDRCSLRCRSEARALHESSLQYGSSCTKPASSGGRVRRDLQSIENQYAIFFQEGPFARHPSWQTMGHLAAG